MKHIKNLLNHTWRSFNPQLIHAFSYEYKSRQVSFNRQTFDIYQANVNHIKAILAVEREVYGATPWEKTAFIQEFGSVLPHLYLCVFFKERLIGFGGVRVTNGDGHITNIAVIPQFQNYHIGRTLMEEFERFTREQKGRVLSLEVRKSNLDAQRFYRNLGFVSTHVKPDYYEYEDGIEMRKAL